MRIIIMNTELNLDLYTNEQLRDAVQYYYNSELEMLERFTKAGQWNLVKLYAESLERLQEALNGDVRDYEGRAMSSVMSVMLAIEKGREDIPASWVLDEQTQVHHDIETFMHTTGLFKLPNAQEIFQALLAVYHYEGNDIDLGAPELIRAFTWEHTPQGHKYWGTIEKALDSL